MLCRYFGDCGGCKLQDIPYAQQIEIKREFILKQAEKHNVVLPDFKVTPSPREFFYRNKIELTFSNGGDGKVNLGFHRYKKNREIIDIDECLIFSERLPLLLSRIKDYVHFLSLPAYDKFSHKGFWRHLLIRRNKEDIFTVAMATSSQFNTDKRALIDALADLDFVKNIYWIVNDRLGDAIAFEDVELLKGDGLLYERVCSTDFIIGLKGFFQVNPWAVESLYCLVLELARRYTSGKVLDLYAGSGGIGLVLAKNGFDVLGIELDDGAVSEARQNMLNNGIKNYSMLKGNVRALLGKNPDWVGKFDTVILDPPRSGMPDKVRRRVLRLAPSNLVYISCNPVTFMADIVDFLEAYRIEDFFAIDMFPHTPHIELVAFMKRKQ